MWSFTGISSDGYNALYTCSPFCACRQARHFGVCCWVLTALICDCGKGTQGSLPVSARYAHVLDATSGTLGTVGPGRWGGTSGARCPALAAAPSRRRAPSQRRQHAPLSTPGSPGRGSLRPMPSDGVGSRGAAEVEGSAWARLSKGLTHGSDTPGIDQATGNFFYPTAVHTSEATRTPCREKEWYGGEQRPETPGRDRGACGPCSCSPHPPWPSTMRRSGRYCSVGCRWSSCAMPRRSQVGDPRGSASTRAGHSATCPPQAGSRPGALGQRGRHVVPIAQVLSESVVSLPGDRPPGVWHGRALVAPRFAFPGPPPRGGADDPGAAARGRASHDGESDPGDPPGQHHRPYRYRSGGW